MTLLSTPKRAPRQSPVENEDERRRPHRQIPRAGLTRRGWTTTLGCCMNDPQAPYCLVYLSQATHDFEAEELADLLAVSRRNNASTGITGLLMYESRLFMQALEGPRAAVEALFQKISRDPRHADRPAAAADWSRMESFRLIQVLYGCPRPPFRPLAAPATSPCRCRSWAKHRQSSQRGAFYKPPCSHGTSR